VTSAPLTIRCYRPGDEERIVELHGLAFGQPLTTDRWRWKLERPRHEVQSCPNVWLAFDAETLIGQYAGIPFRARFFDQEMLAMQSVDTMVHPGFQGRGVMGQLVSHAYREWAGAGLAGVMGIPNQRSSGVLARAGLKALFPLKWLRLPMHLDALLARVREHWARRFVDRLRPMRPMAALASKALRAYWQWRLRNPTSAVDIVSLQREDRGLDDLWSRTRTSVGISPVRDTRWVRWRYLDAVPPIYDVRAAVRHGRIAGYVVWRRPARPGENGYLVDLFVAPGDDDARAALLSEALEANWSAHAGTVRALVVPGSDHHRYLTGTGFLPTQQGGELSWCPFQVPRATVSAPDAWHLAAGDFDQI
jgi:GNAT superfamily N-acetyltransferase